MKKPVGYVDTDSVRTNPEQFKAVMTNRTKIHIYEHSLNNNKLYLDYLKDQIAIDLFVYEIYQHHTTHTQAIKLAMAKGFIDKETCDKALEEITKNSNFYLRKVGING